MATHRIYDNFLIQFENVFLKVELEVDREILALIPECKKLSQQLKDLKEKADTLNALKRSFERYYDQEVELNTFSRLLFKTLCKKQIHLRFLQEKEILLNGYLASTTEKNLPTIVEVNKE